MALPNKKPRITTASETTTNVTPTDVNVSKFLPGTARRRGDGGLFPKIFTIQVSEEMYDAVKAEVARREKTGEPGMVASMGAITREALAAKLGIKP